MKIKIIIIAIALVSFVDLAAAIPEGSIRGRIQGAPLPQVDAIIQEAIKNHEMPGAVVLIGHNGRIIYRKAFGWRSLEPKREPMTIDTIFDLASLTKVVATTTSVMRLVELGKVRLNDPVARYMPEFAVNGKQDITVRQLMIHYSGLAPDIELGRIPNDYHAALQVAFGEKPIVPPGTTFIYSDTNFIVLGALVEQVSGMSLDKYTQAHIFLPLMMSHTRFLPPSSWRSKIAPTEYDERGNMLRGVVHDPRARRMGGVCGHAGLFSTADDLSRFARALLEGNKLLSRLTIEKMTTPQQPPTALAVRGLGWDIDSPLSSNRGELLPVGSFGHTGWTGTSLWIDPTTSTYIIILTNSVHPRGEGNVISLRAKVATAVAASLHLSIPEKENLRLAKLTGYNEAAAAARHVQVRTGDVRTGIDVLEANNFALDAFHSSEIKRIALLATEGATDIHGRLTIDVLSHAPGTALAAIFNIGEQAESAATHAQENTLNTGPQMYGVCNSKGEISIPDDVLASVNALFVDVQDSGTYGGLCDLNLEYVLRKAATTKTEIIILDRPNPLTGAYIQGPSFTSGSQSYPLPARHGMTLGELATMLKTEENIDAPLTIVPMQGWMRGDWFDSTSLPWTNVPPGLHNFDETLLYSGFSLLSETNISLGLGTNMPFEVLGAPWVDSRQLSMYLNSRYIAGVRFIPRAFTPNFGPFAGQACGGVNVIVLDRTVLNPPQLAVEVASAVHQLYPRQYQLGQGSKFLLGDAPLEQEPATVAAKWNDSIASFEQVRQKYLLYK